MHMAMSFKMGNNVGQFIRRWHAFHLSCREPLDLHSCFVSAHLCLSVSVPLQGSLCRNISLKECVIGLKSLHVGTTVSGLILHQTGSILDQIPCCGIPCPPKINMSFPLGCCSSQPSNTKCVCFLPQFCVFLFNLANNDIMWWIHVKQ